MLCNEDVIQNLKDAGCTDNQIKEYMENESQDENNNLLKEHRKKLLKNLHKCQKQIDCLDFLMYNIKNK